VRILEIVKILEIAKILAIARILKIARILHWYLTRTIAVSTISKLFRGSSRVISKDRARIFEDPGLPSRASLLAFLRIVPCHFKDYQVSEGPYKDPR
jgi:hypothetical protein